MPTMPTDAYRKSARERSRFFGGGISHGTRAAGRAAGVHRGNYSAFIKMNSNPVKARAHVN